MEQLTSHRALFYSIALVVVIVVIGMGATLSNPSRGPQELTWERIQREKIIRVGVDPSIPPFGIYTDEGPIGFDPALADALAEQFGAEPQFLLLTFDGLYDSLLLGHVDIVIAALRPDPLRTDRIRYTSPYFDAGQVLVSRTGIENLDVLAGKTLAVEFASEGDIYARQFEELNIERFFTPDEALVAVEAGEVDAALIDSVSVYLYFDTHVNTALQFNPAPLISDPYVIAMRREDWSLHRYLNEALAAMQADGSLETLIRQWVRVSPDSS
jgi:ABC-type amino acid transport substrate-binding protein